MNTPHQCSDSFFTLLATKPPVRTAVDVTPIIDLARRSRSSQLAEFLMFLQSLHAVEMPHHLPAGLRNHLLHRNQQIIAYLHLACYAHYYGCYLSLDLLSICFLTALVHARTNTQIASIHARIPTHTFSNIYHIHTNTLTHIVLFLKAWICVLTCISCIRWINKKHKIKVMLFSQPGELVSDLWKYLWLKYCGHPLQSICKHWCI